MPRVIKAVPQPSEAVTIMRYDSLMETSSLRDAATDAIRYWERRRVLYNIVLAFVVVACFVYYRPASRMMLSLDTVQVIFVLAVLANVAYCTAYLADIFAQLSGVQQRWRAHRWILFVIGMLFASIVTRFVTIGMFGSGG